MSSNCRTSRRLPWVRALLLLALALGCKAVAAQPLSACDVGRGTSAAPPATATTLEAPDPLAAAAALPEAKVAPIRLGADGEVRIRLLPHSGRSNSPHHGAIRAATSRARASERSGDLHAHRLLLLRSGGASSTTTTPPPVL